MTGLLSGSDSERLDSFPATEQTEFVAEAHYVDDEFSGAARTGGQRPAVLAFVFQCLHTSVSD